MVLHLLRVMADVILLLGNFLNIVALADTRFAITAQIAISNIIEACVIGLPIMINNINGQWVLGEEVYIPNVFLCFLCSTAQSVILSHFLWIVLLL